MLHFFIIAVYTCDENILVVSWSNLKNLNFQIFCPHFKGYRISPISDKHHVEKTVSNQADSWQDPDTTNKYHYCFPKDVCCCRASGRCGGAGCCCSCSGPSPGPPTPLSSSSASCTAPTTWTTTCTCSQVTAGKMYSELSLYSVFAGNL